MKRLTILMLIVGLVLVTAAADDEPTTSVDPEAAELVAEMADLLDRALYLAIAALSWPDRDDLTLYVQGVINLVDGPGSPDYNGSGGAMTPNGPGLKDLFLAVQISGLTTTEQEQTLLLPSRIVRTAQAIEHTESYLFLAAEAAKDALDRVYSVTGGREELRAMYAYLLAARGRADDELVLGGIQALAEAYPSREIWLEAEPSVQEAIDRASPGTVIHLEPGTYRENLVIDKDITLVGGLQPVGDRSAPATVIAGAAWDVTVAIEGDGVEARLENLSVAGGTIAVAVSGRTTTTLDCVRIESANTGLSAYNGAFVSCDRCRFDSLEAGMILRSGTETYVSDSAVRGGGTHLFSGASLTMIDTTISGCDGDAITIQGDAVLRLEGCSIVDNEGYGVSAYTAECAAPRGIDPEPEHVFSGTIAGANNAIPGPGEEHGNLEGGVCPASLAFLKEPFPIEVTVGPGESIQAAVNAVVEGGTVLLPEGTYRENLEIGKAITLSGEGGVVLMADSEEAPAILVSETSGVELRNLAFEGTTGVEIRTASCQFIDCTFRTTDVGADVIALGTDAVGFERCTFGGEDRGRGVQLLGDGSVGIDECRFSELGAGTAIGGVVSATIRGSSFEDCYEGVVLASSTTATIEENRFERCYAAGIRVSEAPEASPAGSLVLNGNRFTDGGTWDISLCGFEGTGDLEFSGSLSGTGNVVEGGVERLCPTDYDWPDGFLAE